MRFLGEVSHDQVMRYHRGSVAMVFPSFIESFGHPLVEAMAAGEPIVASEIPTFREIADEAALYFPPTDAAALATAIDRVQSDPEAARKRVERGRERARAFTWKRSIDGLCAVFEEVLREV